MTTTGGSPLQLVTAEQIQELIHEVGRLRQEGQQQQQFINELHDRIAGRDTADDSSDENDRPRRGFAKKDPELDEREFRECPTFAGDTASWDSWSHQLLVCCFRVPEVQRALEAVARQADPSKLNVDQGLLDAHSAHLYRHLTKKTGGEANSLVRGVHDKKGKLCGFTAFSILAQRYNPKTPARLLQHLLGVVSPERVKDVRKLQSHVEAWETRAGKLAHEFGEQLSDKLQTAVFVAMLPKDLQDIAFQACPDGDQAGYRIVRDKIMAIAQNRAHDMSQPVPMDIGYMGNDLAPDDQEDGTQSQVEIDAIRGFCHNCNGWGHAAAECPSEPNAGKNKGKGAGKTNNSKPEHGKNSGKGKGKGKGFQGYCWTCGEKGHSQDRCRAPAPRRVAEVTTDTPEQNTSIANVGKPWPLCSVGVIGNADNKWHLIGAKGGKVRNTNRFAPLAEQDRDLSEFPPLQSCVRPSVESSRSRLHSSRGVGLKSEEVSGRTPVRKARQLPKDTKGYPSPREAQVKSLRLRSLHSTSCSHMLPCISYRCDIHDGQKDRPVIHTPPGLSNVRFIGPVESQVCAVTSEVTVDSAAE